MALFAPGQGAITDLRVLAGSCRLGPRGAGAGILASRIPGEVECGCEAGSFLGSTDWARHDDRVRVQLSGYTESSAPRRSPARPHSFRRCADLLRRAGSRAYIPWARFYKGLALARNGQPHEGLKLMRTGMAGAEEIKMRTARTMHLGHLGSAHGSIGEASVALEILTDALASVEKSGERVSSRNYIDCRRRCFCSWREQKTPSSPWTGL